MEALELLGARAVYASPVSLRLLEYVRRVALSPASVLITGESGAGKEMVARALHAYSRRCSKPWVDVSCAALPEHLVESELFGYERGAFSGADSRKPGLFELANGGTLFLDEIGDLPAKLQVKLLRALDSGTFFRLGGTQRVAVDVRIVTATNRELRAAVDAGEFRKDLYHRLAQLELVVPPLRERREDLPPLAALFLEQYAPGTKLSESAMRALSAYPWPGNVREFRNALISASVACEDAYIDVEHLPESVRGHATDEAMAYSADLGNLLESVENEGMAPDGILATAERTLILRVLERTQGHQERAARALGISSRTLSRKLKTYRLEGAANGYVA
jgi:DNA-binding NtrC family response regulator